MANLTITAANVGVGDGTFLQLIDVGEAVTIVQPVYLSADGKWYKANANSRDAAAARGVTFGKAAANGKCYVLVFGEIKLGAILTAGVQYAVSATSGLICPVGDLVAGKWQRILGVAKDTETLVVDPVETIVEL